MLPDFRASVYFLSFSYTMMPTLVSRVKISYNKFHITMTTRTAKVLQTKISFGWWRY